MADSFGDLAKIQVDGLDSFRDKLNQVQSDFPQLLVGLEREVSDDTATKAQEAARGLGSTAAGVASSIQSVGSDAGWSVELGVGTNRRGTPFDEYAAAAEFGSDFPQFEPFRGADGYFLHPTITDQEQHREDLTVAALDKLFSLF